MAKKAVAFETGKNGFRAESRFIIASPYKIRPVADLVRRKSYPEAMAILEHMPHRGARLSARPLSPPLAVPWNGIKNLTKICSTSRMFRLMKAPGSSGYGFVAGAGRICC